MRAIFIDARNGTVTEIDHTGELRELYATIGCSMVEVVPMRNDEPNDLWLDEEGRLNGTDFGFFFEGVPVYGPTNFCGNALIFTCDDEGGCAPPTIPLEAVQKRVSFWVAKP